MIPSLARFAIIALGYQMLGTC